MIKTIQTLTFAATVTVLSAVGSPSVAYMVYGGPAPVPLNDGAYADGAEATPKAQFTQEPGSVKNGEATSAPVLMSEVRVLADGHVKHALKFVYEASETGNDGNKEVYIQELVVPVGELPIWGFENSITLIHDPEFTATPYQHDPDLGINIPFSLFISKSLFGYDTVILNAIQSNGDNGPNKWLFTDQGFNSKFQPGKLLHNPHSPIHLFNAGALTLLGLGLVCLGFARHRMTAYLAGIIRGSGIIRQTGLATNNQTDFIKFPQEAPIR